jgi:hypothetical protein
MAHPESELKKWVPLRGRYRQSRQELAQLPRPARECARGRWVGWDQAGRILRDFLRVGSLESKRAERPNVP